MAAFAAAIGLTLSTAYAVAAPAFGSVHSGTSAHWAHRTIVVWPGHSIQAAINKASPGDTVLVKRGVYHQSVQIRTNGITLRGSGDSRRGTVLKPPRRKVRHLCNLAFGETGVCILAKKLDPKSGKVIRTVRNDTVTNMYVTGFPGNGVFGYGTVGMRVTRVSAINDGAYGISRFVSSRTLFAWDTARGNSEAGFYVGDSPNAKTVVRNDVATGNQFGVFIRHARHVAVLDNKVAGNCEGILVLDDGQPGGAGNAAIWHNTVLHNNKFCPKSKDTPVTTQGGGILLLGATNTVVAKNGVYGNIGKQFNSGGIVVLSAKKVSHGSNPRFDFILGNHVHHNSPADLIWDGTGKDVIFHANHCGTSIPKGLCH